MNIISSISKCPLALMAGIFCALAPFTASTAEEIPAHIRSLEVSSNPIHVRVLFESNPSREAVIAWTTTTEGDSHRLYYDVTPRNGDLDAYQHNLPSTHSAPYTLRDIEREVGMQSWSHNVYLGDLEPATTYYLTVVSDGQASQEFHFITAPADSSQVRVLAVGDSRTPPAGITSSESERRKVNSLMRRQFEEHPNIIAMLHGADYTNRAYWGELYWWLTDHTELTTTSDNRLLPIIPARGNHDLDIGFEEMFWWPDRETDYYYTTHLNSEVSLITLNTEISRGGDQRIWLENQLAELRPQKRWLIAMYHRPAYPSVRDYEGSAPQRLAWVPLFEQYGIDLGYESHDHALKRTHPIYQNKIDEERGIIYFGDGGGGVLQRQPDPSRWYLAVTGRHYHVHLLTFSDEKLEIKAVTIDDEVVDEFELTHDRRLVPTGN